MIGINEFVLKVYHWGNDRQINQHSTPFAQLCKMKSEAGELADALGKNNLDEVCDGIGDVAVTIVMVGVQFGLSTDMITEVFDRSCRIDEGRAHPDTVLAEALARLSHNEERLFDFVCMQSSGTDTDLASIQATLVGAAYAVKRISEIVGLAFSACLLQAWNEIKDRKGFLSKSGVFIKD